MPLYIHYKTMAVTLWQKVKALIPDGSCITCQQPTSNMICQWCLADYDYFSHSLTVTNLLMWPPIYHHIATPKYQVLRACGYYQWPLDKLIKQYKYHQSGIAAVLADTFITHAIENGEPLPSVLLPVPLSVWRYATRGYNQSALLTKQLGKKLGIPVHYAWAKRTKHTKSQQQLSRQERLDNLKGAFSITAMPQSDHVAIIDDVITTGATVNALVSLLKQHNPQLKVEVWCIAVTPPDRT